jgi:multisubunit Na+/H+ antiporter MnhG subunit
LVAAVRRLLHRWLIEYNPAYLLSATLVLAGVIVISRALAEEGSLYGQLGVAAIAEVYTWCLIGGAALLTRLKLRRPAVMLALLTALYLGDLTLHTETCAYLGSIGLVAALAWLVLFGAKIVALGWAMELSLSASARLLPLGGAVGLVVFPQLFASMGVHTTSQAVGLWVFVLGASALFTSRKARCKAPLDLWGRKVLGRSLRAVWVMWAVLLLGHVAFWAFESKLDIVVLGPALLLLSTRWVRSEAATWGLTAGAMVLVAWVMPGFASVTALMAAGILLLRALRRPIWVRQEVNPSPPSQPYRTAGAPPAPEPLRWTSRGFDVSAPAARIRLYTGAIFAIHLSVWLQGWSQGPWPAHVLALDLLLTAVVLVIVRKRYLHLAVAPLSAVYLHWAAQSGLIRPPQTTLQWGTTSVGVGFALLILSLAGAWYAHSRPVAIPANRSP